MTKGIALFMLWLAVSIVGFNYLVEKSNASDDLRYLKVRSPSVIDVPSQKLQCTVSKNAFRCVEIGQFPNNSQATIFITKKQISVFRTDWSSDQMTTLLSYDR